MSGMKRLAERTLPRDFAECEELCCPPLRDPEPDLFEAQQAKREALEQVAENSGDFMADAHKAVAGLPRGLYTGESVRLYLEGAGIRPHHHNAWGALIAKCVRDGLLKPTGRYLPMRTRKSHARKTPEYVR